MSFGGHDRPVTARRPKSADRATKEAICELAQFLAVPTPQLARELGYEPFYEGEPEPMPIVNLLR